MIILLQGDMVYVKEMKIKNFEIKGKVRNFIKAVSMHILRIAI